MRMHAVLATIAALGGLAIGISLTHASLIRNGTSIMPQESVVHAGIPTKVNLRGIVRSVDPVSRTALFETSLYDKSSSILMRLAINETDLSTIAAELKKSPSGVRVSAYITRESGPLRATMFF